jgi:hypothetical protein
MAANSQSPATAPRLPPAGTDSGKHAAKEAYEFRFVEMGEPSGGCDKDSRSIVRAHVMRDSYMKRKQRTHRDSLPELIAAPPKPPKNEEASQQKFRFKLGPQGLEEVKKRRRKGKNVPANSDRLPATASTSGDSYDQVAIRNQTSSLQTGSSSINPQSPVTALLIENERSAISDEISVLPTSDHPLQLTRAPPLPTIAGSGVLDPFNILPTLTSPRTEILLYHGKCDSNSFREYCFIGQLRSISLRHIHGCKVSNIRFPFRLSACPVANTQLTDYVCDQPTEEFCRRV